MAFGKRIQIQALGRDISVGTALVLLAIDDLQPDDSSSSMVYGYQIMQHLHESYNWDVKSGTVYPILKKLSQEGYISKGIKQSTPLSKRKQVFYQITKFGRDLVQHLNRLDDEHLDQVLSQNTLNSSNISSSSATSTNSITSSMSVSHNISSISDIAQNKRYINGNNINVQSELSSKFKFNKYNFADNYLGVFLRDFDNLISQSLTSDMSKENLNKIENELLKSLEMLDVGKELIENELARLKSLKKLAK